MEQIMCLLFVFGAVCALFSVLGVLAAMIPDRAADVLLETFFGIKKRAAGERGTDSRSKLNNKDSVA